MHLHPDEVDNLVVFGSDNVVIRGESVKIQPESIVEAVREKIESGYRAKIDSLNRLLTNRELEVIAHEREVNKLQMAKQQATRSAFTLTEEFKQLDLEHETALYGLIDSLFRAGDIAGCLQLLSDEVLDAEDKKNARNRRIKARLHSVNFEFSRAEENFIVASRIYPSFAGTQALVNYYLSTDELNKFKDALDEGQELAVTLDEQLFFEIGYMHLLRATGEKLAAMAKMKTCDSLVQLSNRPEPEKRAFTAATLVERGELSSLLPGREKESLKLAKRAMNLYEGLVEDDPENIIGFVSAIHIQGKIYWRTGQLANALLSERLALSTLDRYRSQLHENSSYQTLYLDALLMLNSILAGLGEYQEADVYADRALNRMDSLYGAHPSLALLSRIASARYNKGNQRIKAEAYAEAIPIYDEAERNFQKVLSVDAAGMNKFDFLGQLYNNRGKCYERLNNEAAARTNYIQADSFFNSRLTPEGKSIYDDNSFNAIMNLSESYFRTEDYPEATESYKKSLLQISLLYATEPAYWQHIYVQHVLQTARAHYEVFKATNRPVEFIESYRHVQSAEFLLGKSAKGEQQRNKRAEIKDTKKKLLDMTPLFLQQTMFSEDAFLERISMKSELESSGNMEEMVKAYEGFSLSSMDAILAMKSPFYQAVSEYEDDVNRKTYAWWSGNVALCYLYLGKQEKALYSAESARRYWDNTQNRLILSIIQLLAGEHKDALKTLKTVEMSSSAKVDLLRKGFTALKKGGVRQMPALEMEKIYKKIR